MVYDSEIKKRPRVTFLKTLVKYYLNKNKWFLYDTTPRFAK